MQEIVANVYNVKFDIEIALEQQLGAHPLPFPGMDKSGSSICMFYLRNVCNKGTACPFRHVRGDRSVVCKHWLRGLCKKGDDCEFLHEYDMSKMPECFFFSKFGACSNKECPFLHIDPDAKIKDCAWYDRGFCRHGPNCKNRHVRRVLCRNYLTGFCLDGPKCQYVHPSFEIPQADPALQAKKASITCHNCGEAGHKAVNCPHLTDSMKSEFFRGNQQPSGGGDTGQGPQQSQQQQQHMQNQQQQQQQGNPRFVHPHNPMQRRPLDQVTCFKCGEKGHYANKCPKGHLAFLSSSKP